ncbi:MAG: acyl-ACP--UDP-N-acetylglucosamine O-acyltransferase [Verrucomicrobiota bacterium]
MSAEEKIHERAMVHANAKIGEGTTIGPDAIIDEDVVIGKNCEIRARAILTGKTEIGDENQIGYQAIIGAEPQDLAYQGAESSVQMGSGNVIRENVTIHRGTKEGSATKLGNQNYLMAGAHLAHNCQIGNEVILVNNVLLAGYVEVADFAFLGGDVVVHQFVRIGQYAMVRGQTRLGMDLPPYFMAAFTNKVVGLNRVGLKRRGFGPEQRRVIQLAYNALYKNGLNREQAMNQMQNESTFQIPEIAVLLDFIQNTQRGICQHGADPEC